MKKFTSAAELCILNTLIEDQRCQALTYLVMSVIAQAASNGEGRTSVCIKGEDDGLITYVTQQLHGSGYMVEAKENYLHIVWGLSEKAI